VIRLIVILTEEKLDQVEELLDEYSSLLEKEYQLKKSDARDLITNNIKDENNTYYIYLDGSRPLGLVGGRKEPSLPTEAYITRIFTSEKTDDDTVEINLFKKVFEELSRKYDSIRIMGYEPSLNLEKILNDYNFQRFDRYYMRISRETIEDLPEFDLPSEYLFDTWIEDMRDESIEIMIDAHTGSLDNIIFSYFRDQDAMRAFMDNLENHRWGKFKPNNTTVLKHNDKPIGICFMTVIRQGNGYIPDFVLKTDYKGKGLGKLLFIKSLKWFLEREPKSVAIDLDVTKKNSIAFNIYEKSGFTILRTYPAYVWNKS
jgi:ribosomal protein S18 acetylase RimI-like enzyme